MCIRDRTSRNVGGGGDFTELYALDAEGLVQQTGRIYRGTWPLR